MFMYNSAPWFNPITILRHNIFKPKSYSFLMVKSQEIQSAKILWALPKCEIIMVLSNYSSFQNSNIGLFSIARC